MHFYYSRHDRFISSRVSSSHHEAQQEAEILKRLKQLPKVPFDK